MQKRSNEPYNNVIALPHVKKIQLLLLAMSFLMLVANCASNGSRVQAHQTAFDSWPADIQEKVRAGKVEVGFTKEMVRVALGDPGHQVSRRTDYGESEVWVYLDQKPEFSFGFGMGTSSRNSSFGSGIIVGNDWRDGELMRITFDGDKASAIETRK